LTECKKIIEFVVVPGNLFDVYGERKKLMNVYTCVPKNVPCVVRVIKRITRWSKHRRRKATSCLRVLVTCL